MTGQLRSRCRGVLINERRTGPCTLWLTIVYHRCILDVQNARFGQTSEVFSLAFPPPSVVQAGQVCVFYGQRDSKHCHDSDDLNRTVDVKLRGWCDCPRQRLEPAQPMVHVMKARRFSALIIINICNNDATRRCRWRNLASRVGCEQRPPHVIWASEDQRFIA